MRVIVVVRTHNEAPRLALMLASLERQDGLTEVVVADDGSSDDTGEVLREAASRLPLRVVRHEAPRGRSAASNAAAAAAQGDLLIFMDGDTLAGPGLVAAHLRTAGAQRVARGETWHLRCTRFLADPETGEPWPAKQDRLARASPEERAAMRVTREQVLRDFAEVAARASPGVYAGMAPRRLHQIEMAALRERPGAPRLWAAASGSNLSLPAALFRDAGGFDPGIDLNEHRELAFRCTQRGATLVAAEGATSYHLTHRSGWRDPLADDGWEQRFRSRHPDAPLDDLKRFWAAVSTSGPVPDFFA